LTALVAAPADSGPLVGWSRHAAAAGIDPDVAGLLPFALGPLRDIDPNAAVSQRALAAYSENSRLNLLRVGRLLAVLGHFHEAGIQTVVLKGAAQVLRYYGNYGMRAMADVDVLVRPSDVRRAVALLSTLGWTASGGGHPAGLRRQMRVHHAHAFRAEPPHNLDLHWRVLNITTPEVEEMFWAEVETLDIDSTRVLVLSPTDQIFHICLHALQPNWASSPRWLLDVLAILDAHGPRVQWDRLVDLARRTETTRRLHLAAIELTRVLEGRIPACVLDQLAATDVPAWHRRELAVLLRAPLKAGDLLRWHWYTFRRLRPHDAGWRLQPMPVGFADYLRLKLLVRRHNRTP